MNLIQKEICLSEDIDSRHAANLVYKFASLSCNVWIVKDERKVNAKSILGILSLVLKKGDMISVIIDTDNLNIDKIAEMIND